MKTQTTLPEWIKEGARFRLVKMGDDPTRLPAGSTGTINYVVDLGCIGERGHYQLSGSAGMADAEASWFSGLRMRSNRW